MIDAVIICAGGTGSRLAPLTTAVNKHLLPFGRKPVLSHAVDFAHSLSDRVCVVTSPEAVGSIAKAAKGCFLAVQAEPNGVGGAIKATKHFSVYGGSTLVLLADNLYDRENREIISQACADATDYTTCFVKRVDNPTNYGVLYLDEDGKPSAAVEKPTRPSSDLAITGAYIFDKNLLDYLTFTKLSARGEYEVTDLLNAALSHDQLTYTYLNGSWVDIGGSVEDYMKYAIASELSERFN